MSNLLAEHHASSQSGTLPPELARASRILASASSELSGSMIVSVIVPASIYQVEFLGKGCSLQVK